MPTQETETHTGGGPAIAGNVDTNGGNFTGSNNQPTTINIDSNSLLLALLEFGNRMGNLESLVATRFFIADSQREAMRSAIDHLDDKVNKIPLTRGPSAWVFIGSMWALTLVLIVFSAIIVWVALRK